jgi:GrpB-like predicted nucleotidyltransferase (UPF0157 family)
MITEKQQQWLDHLKMEDRITIVPYDPKSPEIFEKVKDRVIQTLGEGYDVKHRGASYLKISGQNEIDTYIPVAPCDFDTTVRKMATHFGEPKSNYPLVRARFSLQGFEKRIDVFVINENDEGWTESEIFTNYLISHPEALFAYRKLKEDGNGLSSKEYYTRKAEFINEILVKAKQ